MESEEALRPNIRVEIRNNLMESMDTEEANAPSDGEDGEILDSSELNVVNEDINILPRPNPTNRNWENQDSDLNEIDSGKLLERAKRFALKSPNAIVQVTEEQLQELCDSLGIHDEENVKLESIVMHGIQKMNPDDILEYFKRYMPLGMEWISENSCNVVWKDTEMPANALYGLSQSVKGMPVNEEIEESGRSILLRNENREIEMQDDDTDKENGSQASLSDIPKPIPPGYWRLGLPHPKSKCILLRYTLKTDKKAKAFSEFSKICGNLRGIVSETSNFKGIFDRNRDFAEIEDNKNPWGSLAKHWNADIRYAEKEPMHEIPLKQNASKVVSSALQHRLGFKRAHLSEKKEKPEEPIIQKTKAPRMRMYADEEEAKIKRKRQLQALKTIVKEEDDDNSTDDLRQRLPSRRRNTDIISDLPPLPLIIDAFRKMDQADLGAKLKNRSIKQALQLQHQALQMNAREILTAKRQRNEDNFRSSERNDVRSRLDARNMLANERSEHGDARDRLLLSRSKKDSLSNRFTNNDERLDMSKQDRLGALMLKGSRTSSRDESHFRSTRDDRATSKDDRLGNRTSHHRDDRLGNRTSIKDERSGLYSRSSRNDRVNHRRNKSPPRRREHDDRYGSRMRSDRYKSNRKEKNSDYEEDLDASKTNSKVTVVIKKPRTPAVASTVWSRINNEKERLKTVSEGKLRVRKDSTSSSSSSTSSSSSSSSSSSETESSDSEDITIDNPDKISNIQRPGFKNESQSKFNLKAAELKNLMVDINNDHFQSLRIEVNNDHFRK